MWEWIEKEKLNEILPLVQLLNPETDLVILEERLEEMIGRGYECLGYYAENKLVGICGVWILTKFYAGRHIELDNVIVDPEYRGSKLGEELLRKVEEMARERACIAIELNCYVHNANAHKFWFRHGYVIKGFHFIKTLS